MRRLSALLLFALLAATACAANYRAPVKPPGGGLFTRLRAPLQVNFDETSLGSRTATASASYLLIINPFVPLDIAWDSAAVAEAANRGGITTIHHVDYEVLNVLGLYVRLTAHVYGD